MDYYASDPSADKIGQVQSKIEENKNVMRDNIDRVLERGEKIELLVKKTDELGHQASTTAHVPVACLVVVVVVVVVVVIIVVARGARAVGDVVVARRTARLGTCLSSARAARRAFGFLFFAVARASVLFCSVSVASNSRRGAADPTQNA